MMDDSWSDRTILIVGGTSGIGLAAAVSLREAGANLTIIGPTSSAVEDARQALGQVSQRRRSRRDSLYADSHEVSPEAVDRLNRQDASRHIEFVVGDATDPQSPSNAVAATIARFGRLDGLLHVAGGSGRSQGDGALDQVTEDGWRWTVDQNLHSVAWSNRAAVRHWLETNRGGTIVNIGSVLADHPAGQHFCTHAYAASKAAVQGLTRSIATHYARANIRCNVLAPGLMDTPMSSRAQNDAHVMNYVKTKQPLDGGRIGHTDDLTGAILFLLSPASNYITGQIIHVDGGWSVSEGTFA